MRTGFQKLSLLFTLLLISGCSDKSPVTVITPQTGQPPFQKTHGGNNLDEGNSIRRTSSGYVIAGTTTSFGSGFEDVYVLNLASDGSVIWSKTFGGTSEDEGHSAFQTSDGGYVIAGFTSSFGAGAGDLYVLRSGSEGNVLWSRTYGGANTDAALSVSQTSDGGCIVAGYTLSFGAGGIDMYVLRLTSSGGVVWSKTFGGSDADFAYSISETSDGGYIAAGRTSSFGTGGVDVYIVRLSSNGGAVWSRTVGGSGSDGANSVSQTSDGGFIIAGFTSSFGAGMNDIYVVRLSSNGAIVWSKTLGGSGSDGANSVSQTSDGGFIVAGYTGSFGAGGLDMYIVRLQSDGSLMWSKTLGGAIDDIVTSVSLTPDEGYMVAGWSNSFGMGTGVYVGKLSSDGSVCPNSTTPSTLSSSPTPSPTIPLTVTNNPATIVNSPAFVTGSAATQTTVICASSD